eukprot:485693-Rhodomonas_salina.2
MYPSDIFIPHPHSHSSTTVASHAPATATRALSEAASVGGERLRLEQGRSRPTPRRAASGRT